MNYLNSRRKWFSFVSGTVLASCVLATSWCAHAATEEDIEEPVATDAARVGASNHIVESILYSFGTGTPGDDTGPNIPLLQGKDGDFYGTTQEAGASQFGTIFKLTPEGVQKTLHSFSFWADGGVPDALVAGADGNFYGTTFEGGAGIGGTVFKITPAGVFSLVYAFDGGADGASPQGLLQARDGKLYGTTSGFAAGTGTGNGTVFQVTTAGHLTTLHSFTGSVTDGAQPQAGLAIGRDGYFYGTTWAGGANGSGCVFKINYAGVFELVYSFKAEAPDGRDPGAVIEGKDGKFYGTTSEGGANGVGTVFNVTSAGVETVMHSFKGTDGSSPANSVIQASDGNFYGTTQGGGKYDFGTVFQITPAGALTTLYSFTGTHGDGDSPTAGLLRAADGNFYGGTLNGGAHDEGTIFKLTGVIP